MQPPGFYTIRRLTRDFAEKPFEEVMKEQENQPYQNKVQQYLSRLSIQQVNILNLLIDGYKPNKIRQILELSSSEYADNIQIMRSYENIRILF